MNQILIITPEYFDSLSSLLINSFTLLTSIATLILTYWMYKVAYAALNTWRQQDRHQTEVDLMKFLERSKDLIFELRNEYSGNIPHDYQEKLDSDSGQFTHLKRKYLRIQSKLENNSSNIEEIRIKYILAISQLPISNPLRLYYQYVKDTIDSINENYTNFKFLTDSMDSALNERSRSRKELDDLKKLDEDTFSSSEYGWRYINLEEARQSINDSHETDVKRWNTILKNIKAAENVLFLRSINDEIYNNMTKLYGNAKIYCENYSNPKSKL